MTGLKPYAFVLMGLGLASAISGIAAAAAPALPDAVDKTFKASFPQAKITEVESEVEDGVTVHVIEFTDGKIEKTADIAADGTMLETTAVIAAAELPEAVMKTIQKEAPGATISTVERVEISNETRQGYTYKLPSVATQYEVKLTKGKSKGETVVGPDGKLIESARWD